MLSTVPTQQLEPITSLGSLPAKLKVLFVTTGQRTGGWLAEAFASDSATQVELEEAASRHAGAARLRETTYDAVLVSHDAHRLDALDFVEGLRASGSEVPLVVLGDPSEQELTALCYEAGADAYVCVHTSTTRVLFWRVARAMERHRLLDAARRLQCVEQQRLQKEKDEARRRLEQERQLLVDITYEQQQNSEVDTVGGPLPDCLCALYADLLRSYVIMGTGTLATELSKLADLLAQNRISARQTLGMHLEALETLICGLGNRSTHHVMARADLLLLELVVHLAESYQQRYERRAQPSEQLWLPGFDAQPQE